MHISKNSVFKFSFLSGGLLLYSYYFLLKDKSKSNIEKYWGGITGNTRTIYILSMFLCVLSMFSIMRKIYISKKMNYEDELYGLILLIITSMFYLPFTIRYVENPSLMTFINIVSTLFYVALGAVILYRLYPGIDSGYLAFHLIVLDLFYWSYNFFNF